MSSKAPMIRQVAWLSLLPQLAVMALLMYICSLFTEKEFALYGAIIYLFLSLTLRRVIPKAHRKGVLAIGAGNYHHAIACFLESYAFFRRHDWLDRYRYLTMLSSSKMSYKEMALNNVAFAYGQLGNGEQAKAYYEQALKEFPDSAVAKAGLNLLNSMSNNE